MRARLLLWLAPVTALALAAAVILSLRTVDDRSEARQRETQRSACLQGTRLIVIAADLIEENASLMEENFRDLVRVRRLRGETALAKHSAELLTRATVARERVHEIRAIAAARNCDR